MEQLEDGLYRIGVPLPENPLRQLNSYVIMGTARPLLVDTGFYHPACQDALEKGLKELGLGWGEVDLFLTHLHSDHTGLSCLAAESGSCIRLHPLDQEYLHCCIAGDEGWKAQAQSFLAQGFPPEELERAWRENPGRAYQPPAPFPSLDVEDGQILDLGGVHLRCVTTPGHTPGHTCLYWQEREILFSGDHILFDITPNLSPWPQLPNPLQAYFNSLEKVEQLPVSLCLPGHRSCGTQVRERVQQLRQHHQERLEEVLQIVEHHPGITGYQVAQQMTWSIRVKSWTEFPLGQKWFAVGEALVHLVYLVEKGILAQDSQNGVQGYWRLPSSF